MPYPPPPWNLQGHCLQTLHLINIQHARHYIPEAFEIVAVLPGRTLGGIYLAHYGTGSVLEYNELIVVPGFVRYGGKVGAWISHIYVDNADSLAGGREIWGLPKELATFNWLSHGIEVNQDEQHLCQLTYRTNWLSTLPNISLTVPGPVLSQLNDDILLFTGQFKVKTQTVKGQLEISDNSPFAKLALGQPWLTAKMDSLQLTAGAPYKLSPTKKLQD